MAMDENGWQNGVLGKLLFYGFYLALIFLFVWNFVDPCKGWNRKGSSTSYEYWQCLFGDERYRN